MPRHTAVVLDTEEWPAGRRVTVRPGAGAWGRGPHDLLDTYSPDLYDACSMMTQMHMTLFAQNAEVVWTLRFRRSTEKFR